VAGNGYSAGRVKPGDEKIIIIMVLKSLISNNCEKKIQVFDNFPTFQAFSINANISCNYRKRLKAQLPAPRSIIDVFCLLHALLHHHP
jgi:hypothetical protein